MSSDFNHKQYSENFQQYLESNTTGDIGGGNPQSRVALLKKFLPEGRAVIEIGSGGGDDALELQKAGYTVTASDYVDTFVDILKDKGLDAIVFDAKKDEVPPTDAVYANAVFVHFSSEELEDFIKRIKNNLQNEKILFVTLLKGEGYERSARGRGFERDFYYYTVDSIKSILEKEGFKLLHSEEIDSKWLQVVATLH